MVDAGVVHSIFGICLSWGSNWRFEGNGGSHFPIGLGRRKSWRGRKEESPSTLSLLQVAPTTTMVDGNGEPRGDENGGKEVADAAREARVGGSMGAEVNGVQPI